MLSKLSVDEVKRVHDLAVRAVAARDRLINKTYSPDLGDQPQERGSRQPTDLDSMEILDVTDSPEYRDLHQAIDQLSPEAREELKAVMLVGRGDFAAKEWDEAIAQGQQVPATGDADYLAEKATLAQYLMKGLYELKLL